MNFRQWLKKSGMSAWMFSKYCKLSAGTIKNLVDGKGAVCGKTIRRLMMKTKYMTIPIKWEMFKKIRGKRTSK